MYVDRDGKPPTRRQLTILYTLYAIVVATFCLEGLLFWLARRSGGDLTPLMGKIAFVGFLPTGALILGLEAVWGFKLVHRE